MQEVAVSQWILQNFLLSEEQKSDWLTEWHIPKKILWEIRLLLLRLSQTLSRTERERKITIFALVLLLRSVLVQGFPAELFSEPWMFEAFQERLKFPNISNRSELWFLLLRLSQTLSRIERERKITIFALVLLLLSVLIEGFPVELFLEPWIFEAFQDGLKFPNISNRS